MTQLAMRDAMQVDGGLLEKVIIKNDFSGLTSIEKVQHIKNVCQTLGLNPLTKPIQLISFQGKEVPYFTKDATEQLRKINNISLSIVDTKLIDDIYVVVVEATTPDGRKDSATGAILSANLKGEAKANAMMKAETKAKRRVTLSICGLGFMDESEVDSIPNARKIDAFEEAPDLEVQLLALEHCESVGELQKVYTDSYKYWMVKRDQIALQKIMDMKDKVKLKLEDTEVIHEFAL